MVRKKMISVILALMMVIGLFSVLLGTAYAEELTVGDYTYELLENGTARITRYNGTEEKLSIPSLLNGYTVTSIGKTAFMNIPSIEDVEIPDTVIEIGEYAFDSCNNLKKVKLPTNLKVLEVSVFSVCLDLETVIFPKNLEVIKDDVFTMCISLKDIVFPDTVKSIGNNAFEMNEKLEKVILPRHLESIGKEAFKGCKNIDYIYVPETVTTIGNDAFKISRPPLLGAAPPVIIYGFKNSRAESFVTQNNKKYSLKPEYQLDFQIITEYPSSDVKRGDADGDGEITSLDVTYIQRFCSKLKTDVDTDTLMQGDVDGNGVLEIVDATFIQRYIAKMDIPYSIG